MLSNQVYELLSPAAGFRLATTFFIKEHHHDKTPRDLVFWDNFQAKSKDSAAGGFKLALYYHGQGDFTPEATLAMNGEQLSFRGKRFNIELARWHQFEFEFSGMGDIHFTLNGIEVGSALLPSGPLSASAARLVLGASANKKSRSSGYAAEIGGILLSELPGKELFVSALASKRRVFRLAESKAQLYLQICNFGQKPLMDLELLMSLPGLGSSKQATKLEQLQAGEKREIIYDLDCRLLPGEQSLQVQTRQADNLLDTSLVHFYIIEPMPEKIPMILMTNLARFDPELARELGFDVVNFTGQYFFKENSEECIIEQNNILEQHAKAGVFLEDVCGPRNFRFNKDMHAIARNGQLYPERSSVLHGNNQEFRKQYLQRLQIYLESLDRHPAIYSAKINDEYPPRRQPDFSPESKAAFKEFAGIDIPAQVEGQRGPSYLQLSNFPLDGVLLENHPLLTYYHWFWTMGSGWEPLQSDIAKTYQRHWGDDFVSIHPPATRCPPYWGGGGEVSWVQNWTYINPNPSRILLSCDELRALAKGRPGQKIFNSIQGIAYRRDLAPRNVIPSPAPAWLENEMDSSYISPAPDAIREAFWCLLSRQVAAIGTFGTGSLFASTSPSTDHRFTNPESGKVFSEMIRKVMQPLSPMLLKLPEIEAEIAILESFSNVIFGGNHTNSWSSGRIGDLHMALQYAGLQTSVVYEDELLAGGGGRLRLLFLPGLETVSAALHARLQELQKAGLILVGDELTYAALTPDFRLHSLVSNPKLPQRAKQQQQAQGKTILAMLKDIYRPTMRREQDDVLLQCRRFNEAEYLFVINDRRVFGDYLGAWGLMEEKGLPIETELSLDSKYDQAYDLVSHRAVELDSEAQGSRLKLRLEAGDGRLLMLLRRQKIARLELLKPKIPAAGQSYDLQLRILDENNNPVQALLPYSLTIRDGAGRLLPGSGSRAAENGIDKISLLRTLDQLQGPLSFELQCLASGLQTKEICDLY